ncbi:Caspase [Melipona quadrifasciata]|uniref:Caspase n=1 Tax=Melipona quadrifasciata TaxID=166423 RepID=A0A0M8ZZ29_9HYME|nr:Caspase [Melipona quadrifasciata]
MSENKTCVAARGTSYSGYKSYLGGHSSRFQGFYSWRSPDNGSWFIQALCQELNENWKTRDLLRMMTAVVRRVAIDHQSYVPHDESFHEKKQVPSIVSMLTRFFTNVQSALEICVALCVACLTNYSSRINCVINLRQRVHVQHIYKIKKNNVLCKKPSHSDCSAQSLHLKFIIQPWTCLSVESARRSALTVENMSYTLQTGGDADMEERRKLKSSANVAGKDLKGVIREANGVKDFPPPSTPMFHRGNESEICKSLNPEMFKLLQFSRIILSLFHPLHEIPIHNPRSTNVFTALLAYDKFITPRRKLCLNPRCCILSCIHASQAVSKACADNGETSADSLIARVCNSADRATDRKAGHDTTSEENMAVPDTGNTSSLSVETMPSTSSQALSYLLLDVIRPTSICCLIIRQHQEKFDKMTKKHHTASFKGLVQRKEFNLQDCDGFDRKENSSAILQNLTGKCNL